MTREKYTDSVKKLNFWANSYYVHSNPQATDYEYDVLYHKVLDYEKANPTHTLKTSPTQRIGDVLLDGFKTRKHLKKMYSIEDAHTEEEILDFLKKHPLHTKYLAEPKFDGASLNLLYEDGMLVSAITRGDGEEGEDITLNAPHILGIPLSIKENSRIEIRGEVTIMLADLEDVNRFRETIGKEPFKNVRNGASGALGVLQSSTIKGYKLHFTPYSIGYNSLELDTQEEEHIFLKNQGFAFWGINKYEILDTPESVLDAYRNFIEIRSSFPMELDGMVLKIDSKEKQEELGETSKYPRWALACKFPPMEKTTKIEDIILQVGKTGAITPVAIVSAVELSGVTVTRSTLHNFEEISRKDIRIGDMVSIVRSGDVIPKINSVFEGRRDGTQVPYIEPTVCPSCGGGELDDSQTVLRCANPHCKAKLIGVLSYAIGRKALDIDGLGHKAIVNMVESGLIEDMGDLWKLEKNDFFKIEGFKDKKVDNAYSGIQATIGNTEASKVLNALDIPHVGQSVSKELVLTFGERVFDIENPLSYDELIEKDGIGEETANAFVQFFSENADFIVEVVEAIKPVFIKEEPVGDVFRDKTIVLTGTLSKGKKYFEEIILKNGGKISGSVSSKTSFVLYGEKAGSKKDKAIALGINTFSEEEFLTKFTV